MEKSRKTKLKKNRLHFDVASRCLSQFAEAERQKNVPRMLACLCVLKQTFVNNLSSTVAEKLIAEDVLRSLTDVLSRKYIPGDETNHVSHSQLELGRVSVSYSGTISICLKMTPTIGIVICFELSRIQQIVLE